MIASARWAPLLVVGVVLGASACSREPEVSVPCGGRSTEQYAVHEGVPADLNSVDVYRPPADDGGCSDRPLVVWVHGGGWTDGDKTDDIGDKVRLFTDAGDVFASVNYRLTDPTRVPAAPRYPVHDQDVADGVAWLIDHADELGIDPDRVALLGHSAGGGIVAAITTDETYLQAHGLGLDAVRCAASIDGEGYDVTRGATDPNPLVHTAYLNAFGDDPATWATASPMNHIAAGTDIPDYFVAARGSLFRLDLHAHFIAALQAAGVPVTVIDARSLDHGEVAVDIGAPGDTVVTPPLTSFLTGCFGEE